MGLSERQVRAISFVKIKGRITNREYQEISGTGNRTALRDLDDLVAKGVLAKVGDTGRATHHVFNRKPDINPPNAP